MKNTERKNHLNLLFINRVIAEVDFQRLEPKRISLSKADD